MFFSDVIIVLGVLLFFTTSRTPKLSLSIKYGVLNFTSIYGGRRTLIKWSMYVKCPSERAIATIY